MYVYLTNLAYFRFLHRLFAGLKINFCAVDNSAVRARQEVNSCQAISNATTTTTSKESTGNHKHRLTQCIPFFLSAGCFRQGCGHSKICRQCQFGGVDESDKEHREITDSGDKPKSRTENNRVKKNVASIPSYSMNLWSLAPHQLPARPKQTRFHLQKPWREEIKRWLSPGFLRREGLEMQPGCFIISEKFIGKLPWVPEPNKDFKNKKKKRKREEKENKSFLFFFSRFLLRSSKVCAQASIVCRLILVSFTDRQQATSNFFVLQKIESSFISIPH